MPSNEFIRITPSNAETIRFDQYKLMWALWKSWAFDENNTIDRNRFMLSRPLMHDAIEHFINDVDILKIRYKIARKDIIHPHKEAGLITAAFLRYRPIIPLFKQPKYEEHEIYYNEVFATLIGLAMCGSLLEEEKPSFKMVEKIKKEPWFKYWFEDFLHLLQRRNFTSESLMGIYETLSLIAFPGYKEKCFPQK
jgi:hypothetical protein